MATSSRCDRVNAIYKFIPLQKQSNIRSILQFEVLIHMRLKEKIPDSYASVNKALYGNKTTKILASYTCR